MTARIYIRRLSVTLLIFLVVIPALVVGLIYLMGTTPSSSGLGFAYAAFFLGIPLWIVSLGIAMWRITSVRARTVGLPFWIAPALFILIVADWRFVIGMLERRELQFLIGAALLLVALMFWPEQAATRGQGFRRISQHAAVFAFGIYAALGAVSLAGMLYTYVEFSSAAFMLSLYSRMYAGYWLPVLFIAIVLAVVVAIVERSRASTA